MPILYFSRKNEYNIPNKHLKEASQTGEHKGSQTKKTYYLRRNNTTIK